MTSTIPKTLHVICDKDELLIAIQAADAVVPTNSSKPILTNLLFDAKDKELEIVATDMQVGLRALVKGVQIEKKGLAVVQARQMVGILKESHSKSVTLLLTQKDGNGQLTISLADGEYQVPAVIGEEFPPIQTIPKDVPVIIIAGSRFEEMIRQTVFGVDRDRTSAVLSGIHIAVDDGEIIFAATDGKMLCEATEPRKEKKKGDGDGAIQAVVPAVTINHLQRILSVVQPERVELAFTGKLVFIRLVMPGGREVEMASRLVEGSFPAYRNALPASVPAHVTFTTAELASAVRRAALMTSQTSRGIILALDTDQALLSNLNYTNGSARIPVTCEYQGEKLNLGINAQYLSDVLKVYKGDTIRIELSRGLIIREPGATYLIMPISLPS